MIDWDIPQDYKPRDYEGVAYHRCPPHIQALHDGVDYDEIFPPLHGNKKLTPREQAIRLIQIIEAGYYDFFFFNTRILGMDHHPNLPSKGRLAPVHKQMCDFVQEHRTDILILVARGHLKSSLITEGYPLWQGIKNPDVKFLIANATLGFAKDFLARIKRYIRENTNLRTLYPHIVPEFLKEGANIAKQYRTEWAKESILFGGTSQKAGRAPSIRVIGTGTNITGQHPTHFIGDDLINKDTVVSKTRMKRAHAFVEEIFNLVQEKNKIFIGTIWKRGDIYDYLQTLPQFKVLKVPGVIPEKKWVAFPQKFCFDTSELEYDKLGRPTKIAYYMAPEDKGKKIKGTVLSQSLTKRKFASQYLLKHISGDVQSFDFDDLRYFEINGEFLKQGCSFSCYYKDPLTPNKFSPLSPGLKEIEDIRVKLAVICDPARSIKEKSDDTVILVMGKEIGIKNRVFIFDCLAFKTNKTSPIIDNMVKLGDKWQTNNFWIEVHGGGGGGDWVETAATLYQNATGNVFKYKKLDPYQRQSKGKVSRILSLQNYTENHKFFLRAGPNTPEKDLNWVNDFVDQMTSWDPEIAGQGIDDRLDAAGYGVTQVFSAKKKRKRRNPTNYKDKYGWVIDPLMGY